jgi:GNAT superfamily N-acetyltransferase
MITTKHHSNLTQAHKESIFELWNAEYPQQLGFQALASLDDYLSNLNDQSHYFALDENNKVQGWAFVFERENEKWFAMILNRSIHGKGIGTSLLNLLKENETILNGWVIDNATYERADGSGYPSPLLFYLKKDFIMHPEIRLETPELSAIKITWNL